MLDRNAWRIPGVLLLRLRAFQDPAKSLLGELLCPSPPIPTDSIGKKWGAEPAAPTRNGRGVRRGRSGEPGRYRVSVLMLIMPPLNCSSVMELPSKYSRQRAAIPSRDSSK